MKGSRPVLVGLGGVGLWAFVCGCVAVAVAAHAALNARVAAHAAVQSSEALQALVRAERRPDPVDVAEPSGGAMPLCQSLALGVRLSVDARGSIELGINDRGAGADAAMATVAMPQAASVLVAVDVLGRQGREGAIAAGRVLEQYKAPLSVAERAELEARIGEKRAEQDRLYS